MPAGWPSNWESLVWQLARFFHCGPEPFWRMTGLQLLEGCNAANTMIEAEAKRRAHAR